MKKLVALLLVSLVATSAFATIDPDPNGIGVYFDMGANVVETFVPLFTPFDAYVIVTNPTEADVAGVEYAYTITASGPITRLVESTPGINVANSTDPLMGEYLIGFSVPTPSAPAVVVTTWQFMLMAAGVTMEFELGPVFNVTPSNGDGNPGYTSSALLSGGTVLPLGESSNFGPEALVNLDGVVATEEASFGSVKALFR